MTEEDKPDIHQRRAGTSRRLIQPKPAKPGAADHQHALVTNSSLPIDQTAKKDPLPRFHFFLIDSGWNTAAAQVIRDNIEMITRFQNHDPLFVLNREQSTALMRRHPHLIGRDPILLARDLRARGASGGSEYHGFHLNMGLIREPNKAVAGMRKFLHLLAAHRESADIERDVKALLHRKGLTGAIEVLRVGAEAGMG